MEKNELEPVEYDSSDVFSDLTPKTGNSTSSNTNNHEIVDILQPSEVRWFYSSPKKTWIPFLGYDSLRIEISYRQLHSGINGLESFSVDTISVRGDLYEVDLLSKTCSPIYWSGESVDVLRGSWFFDVGWQPLEEEYASQLEIEHLAKFAGWKNVTTLNNSHDLNQRVENIVKEELAKMENNKTSIKGKNSPLGKLRSKNMSPKHSVIGKVSPLLISQQPAVDAKSDGSNQRSQSLDPSSHMYSPLISEVPTSLNNNNGLETQTKGDKKESLANGHIPLQNLSTVPENENADETCTTETKPNSLINHGPISPLKGGDGKTLSSATKKKATSYYATPLHTLNFKDFYVEWYSPNEVYMFSLATSSKLYRSLTYALGFQKTGLRLNRGYCIQANENDKPPDITHLVFVIHGIGAKLDASKCIRNCGVMRDQAAKLKQKCFSEKTAQIIGNLTAVDKLKNPNIEDEIKQNIEKDCVLARAEFLPIEWRANLKLDDGAVDMVSPKNVIGLRSILNTTVMDIMYYTSPIFRNEILTGVKNELNRLYNMFCQRHPNFAKDPKNKVSIIAHSLGSVIIHDIMSGWNPSYIHQNYVDQTLNDVIEDASSPEDKENWLKFAENLKAQVVDIEKKLIYIRKDRSSLKFKVENLFLLGSPLAVFLVMRGISIYGRSVNADKSALQEKLLQVTPREDTTTSFSKTQFPSSTSVINSARKTFFDQSLDVMLKNENISQQDEPAKKAQQTPLRPSPPRPVTPPKPNILKMSTETEQNEKNHTLKSPDSLTSSPTGGEKESLQQELERMDKEHNRNRTSSFSNNKNNNDNKAKSNSDIIQKQGKEKEPQFDNDYQKEGENYDETDTHISTNTSFKPKISVLLPRSICNYIYNIYHPTDPVAYRLEPLISFDYINVKPVPVYRYETANKVAYDQIAPENYNVNVNSINPTSNSNQSTNPNINCSTNYINNASGLLSDALIENSENINMVNTDMDTSLIPDMDDLDPQGRSTPLNQPISDTILHRKHTKLESSNKRTQSHHTYTDPLTKKMIPKPALIDNTANIPNLEDDSFKEYQSTAGLQMQYGSIAIDPTIIRSAHFSSLHESPTHDSNTKDENTPLNDTNTTSPVDTNNSQFSTPLITHNQGIPTQSTAIGDHHFSEKSNLTDRANTSYWTPNLDFIRTYWKRSSSLENKEGNSSLATTLPSDIEMTSKPLSSNTIDHKNVSTSDIAINSSPSKSSTSIADSIKVKYVANNNHDDLLNHQNSNVGKSINLFEAPLNTETDDHETGKIIMIDESGHQLGGQDSNMTEPQESVQDTRSDGQQTSKAVKFAPPNKINNVTELIQPSTPLNTNGKRISATSGISMVAGVKNRLSQTKIPLIGGGGGSSSAKKSSITNEKKLIKQRSNEKTREPNNKANDQGTDEDKNSETLHPKLEYRVDYTIPMGWTFVNNYVSAITAHTSYWNNPDVIYFVLQHLFPD